MKAVAKALIFYRCSGYTIIEGVISLSVVRSCGLSGCVCDCTELHHRWQKDQHLLQHHCIRDAFSDGLPSSEQGSKVFKKKNCFKLVSSASLFGSADAAAENMAMFIPFSEPWPVRVGFVSSHCI